MNFSSDKRQFLKTAGTGALGGIVGALAAGHMLTPSEDSSGKISTAFDRVMQSGKLRCGYLVYAPNFIKDPNTQRYSGVFNDLTQAVGQALGIQIEWVEEGSVTTLTESLRLGRIDAVCSGLWSNAVRGKVLDFGRAVFFNALGVYVRADDARFDNNLNQLNNPSARIAVIDGEMADQVASSDFPKARKVSLPQLSDFSQLLLNVAMGKADATIAATHEAILFNQHNSRKLKRIDTGQPIRIFPNVFFFNKGETKLASMLNAAIDEIDYKGQLDKIIDQYEPASGVFYRAAHNYRSA